MITAQGGIKTDTIQCSTGQQLVLNAGESASQATGQSAENVYINAEAGLIVSSHPNNWTGGWSGRWTTTIGNNQGDSYFPNDIYVADQIIHTGDTNTYMQFSAADTWRVVTNGIQRLSVNNSLVAIGRDVNIDAGQNSTLNIISDDNGKSTINLYGGSQGTGMVFVGQSSSYGGGIEYNGDSSPATSGAGSDQIALFRRNSNTVSWTAKNSVNNNDWKFRGNVTAYASDERLKDNVTTIDNALDKVSQLRGVTYAWKDDVEEKGFLPSMKHETGVIAQEVQKVIPDAVVPAPFDNEYLTVQHEKIIPVLIEAIKELKAEVEQLKGGS